MTSLEWFSVALIIIGVLWFAYGVLRARERVMWREMAADLRRREVEEQRRRREQ